MAKQGDDGILWCQETWNPVRGCSRVSSGCTRCYAERMASRFNGPGQPYEGLAENGRWTGMVRLAPEALDQPLRWRKPRRIFVNSMSDLFHESLDFKDVATVFGIMAGAPRHTFQVLTKRPKRMREFFAWLEEKGRQAGEVFPSDGVGWRILQVLRARALITGPVEIGTRWPLPNVWLGVSAENQPTLDERGRELLQTPAAVRFISYEPALGPLDLRPFLGPQAMSFTASGAASVRRGLDWIIVGGESGPGARPAHPDWFRAARDAAAEWSVPFFFKQWGEWAPLQGHPGAMKAFSTTTNSINDGDTMVKVGKAAAGRLLDGRTHDEFPDGDR